MKTSHLHLISGVALAALAFAPAHAQDAQPQGDTISWPDAPITVVGRPLDAPIGDRAYSVTILSPDMLANEPSQRVENALRLVPGLQQFRRSDARSANPTSQGVTLRGLGGNASSRVLMLLDGVPQSDPFGGWISFPGYDAINLASVRVRRGGGTGGDGPGALAGTIELDSSGIAPDQSNIYSDLAYGSRESIEASIGTTQALGQGGLTISAQYARGDGFTPVIARQRGPVDRPAPYEQLGVNLRFVAPLSASTELQASGRIFTDERERGFAFSDNRNDGADASLRLVGRGKLPWSALAYVQMRRFESSFGAISADRRTVTQSLDQYNTPSTGELYRPFRVGPDATAANAALAPERLRGAELGLDYEIYTIRLGATVFWNRLDNAIANVTLARGPGTFPGVGFVSAAGAFSQRQNLGSVEAMGVELEASGEIGDVRLAAAYSFVDAEVEAAPGQAAIDGRRPAQVPRHFATGSIGWFPQGGDSGVNLTARYVGSQFEDDLGQLALDDAVTLDARAAMRINRNLLVELRGENLFDTTVQAGISGPGIIERATPRTIWLGVKLDIE
ncbi:TonB-dependent receptor [Blastomonas sp. UPD001]|uniref:TonB-dependent receptor domain-containing protein n=1 Tax=Blastomonas sp. UPD001 TaxID=2217673 RepID=UPI000E34F7D0|nr:TonB-dependent receptor [Blastomonas sp. UPD001]